ncbi:hypothetical protein DW083_17820 [Parabacteroides sp. AF48-14]|nr:hypothetical protein DW083_17820 [Parabacteroides sp. AF48-14]
MISREYIFDTLINVSDAPINIFEGGKNINDILINKFPAGLMQHLFVNKSKSAQVLLNFREASVSIFSYLISDKIKQKL